MDLTHCDTESLVVIPSQSDSNFQESGSSSGMKITTLVSCPSNTSNETSSSQNTIRSSLLDKRISIPGESYILILVLKGETSKERTIQYDCVLCNTSASEAQFLNGKDFKFHIRSRSHLLNILELDNLHLYKKYKEDRTVSEAMLMEAVLKHQSDSERLIVTSANYSEKRSALVAKILQLRNTYKRVSEQLYEGESTSEHKTAEFEEGEWKQISNSKEREGAMSISERTFERTSSSVKRVCKKTSSSEQRRSGSTSSLDLSDLDSASSSEQREWETPDLSWESTSTCKQERTFTPEQERTFTSKQERTFTSKHERTFTPEHERAFTPEQERTSTFEQRREITDPYKPTEWEISPEPREWKRTYTSEHKSTSSFEQRREITALYKPGERERISSEPRERERISSEPRERERISSEPRERERISSETREWERTSTSERRKRTSPMEQRDQKRLRKYESLSSARKIFGQDSLTSWRGVLTPLNYLMVGDERVRAFKMDTPRGQVPHIQFEYRSRADSWKILELAELALQEHQDTDILILLGFNYDFVRYRKVNTSEILEPATPNIPAIVQEYGVRINKWQDKYPSLRVIPTLPYIPDFKRHTDLQLQSNLNYLEIAAQFRVSEYNHDFLNFTNQVLTVWRQLLHGYLYSMQGLFRQTGLPRRRLTDDARSCGTTINGLQPDHNTVERFWMEFPRFIKKGYRKNTWRIVWREERNPAYIRSRSELQQPFADDEREKKERDGRNKECQRLQDAIDWAHKLKRTTPVALRTVVQEEQIKEETIEETIEDPQPGPSGIRVMKIKEFTTALQKRKSSVIEESEDSDTCNEITMSALERIEKEYQHSQKKKNKSCQGEKTTSGKSGLSEEEERMFRKCIKNLYNKEEEKIKKMLKEMIMKEVGKWIDKTMK